MTSYVYAITVFLGVILTVHLAMNGAVGAVIRAEVLFLEKLPGFDLVPPEAVKAILHLGRHLGEIQQPLIAARCVALTSRFFGEDEDGEHSLAREKSIGAEVWPCTRPS